MLNLRLLTVAIVLPLFAAGLWFLPNRWWAAVLLLVVLLAGHEWARLGGFSKVTEVLFLALLLSGGALLWFISSASASLHGSAAALNDRIVYAISVAFWCVMAPCWLWLKPRIRNCAVLSAVGLIVLLPTWLALTQLQRDPLWLLLLLAVIWIADSAAYFTGRAIGRHHLAPVISPGKTWEGVAGAFAAVAVYSSLLSLMGGWKHSATAIFGTFMAMFAFSIIGDLFESWCKRQAGVKDSGKVLPGHGGILDRIDGVTAALPLAALMLR